MMMGKLIGWRGFLVGAGSFGYCGTSWTINSPVDHDVCK